MKYLILITCSLLTLNSCNNKAGKKTTTNGVTYTNYNTKMKDTTFVDVRGNKYPYFSRIPDSLCTSEQQALAKAIKDVLLNGVVVEGNKQVLKFSKEECLAKGLPAKYYEELKNNIRTNNSFFDAYGIKGSDRIKDKLGLDSSLRTLPY
ncbi:hypothetical protein HDF26_001680 [Pedobacter cryoconitis]|uniref:hypothetical protein n=1 Tax=Pedobacter cryoconitis TaxID=188932 RepID=UPI001613DF2B|nr:hypothetical protein [Pedobacter cryoconitis]MBB6271253.1 hypothetical protein [Pedobacter cryoconitis]